MSVKIFKCRLPEIAGYGIESYGTTKDEAVRGAKKMFASMKKDWEWDETENDHLQTFEKAMDYFGGSIVAITVPCVGNTDECGEEV